MHFYSVLFTRFLSYSFIVIKERLLYFICLLISLRFLSFILLAINPIYCMRIQNFSLSNATLAVKVISSVSSLPKYLIGHEGQQSDGDTNHQLC